MYDYERMRRLSIILSRTVAIGAQVGKSSSLKSIHAVCLCTSASRKGDKSSTAPTPNDLRSERISLRADLQNITLDAVFQDTMPSGSKVGTVVAAHGALGSHKDFKYLLPPLRKAGVRLIGVNFPGLGFTPDAAELKHTNEERSNYVQAIVDKLDLKEKLIFLGHSRGSENALRLAARNRENCVGAILVNPMGLRPNRGVQPLFVIHICTYLWSLGRATQFFLRPFVVWFCGSVLQFPVPSAERGAVALRLLTNAQFSSQRQIIAELNNRPELIVLVAYGGSDLHIETEISRELVDTFNAHLEIVCNADGHENSTASQEFEKLLREGRTKVAVRFEKDNHFLQKSRALFLADAICSTLANTK